MKIQELVKIDNHYVPVEREMTEEEMRSLETFTPEMQIQMLKKNLADTDYKALKFSDGALTEEEYASIRAQRQSWRDEINTLEEKICQKSETVGA